MGVVDIKGFLPIHVASMQEQAMPLTILLQADAAADTNKSNHHIILCVDTTCIYSIVE